MEFRDPPYKPKGVVAAAASPRKTAARRSPKKASPSKSKKVGTSPARHKAIPDDVFSYLAGDSERISEFTAADCGIANRSKGQGTGTNPLIGNKITL